MRHDVTFPLFVEVDEIYNLACPASPIHYQFDPIQTTKTSVIGAINMLGLAKRLKITILQASTSEVYGDPDVHPQTDPIGAMSIRWAGPAMMKASAARKPCSSITTASTICAIKVARIFNTYGPRMHPNDGRVVSNFIVQALKGEDITIYGEGRQTRSFCYVDDLVSGLVKLMATEDSRHWPGQSGKSFRILHSRIGSTSLLELTGSRSRLIDAALPADDPQQRQPDISLARTVLGWEPRTQLREV